MNELLKQIDKLFPEEMENRHSFFQLQYFVVGSEPTIQAKIRACKREIIARKKSIESLEIQIEESHDQQRLLELQIQSLKRDEYDEVNEIKIRQLKRKMKCQDLQTEELKTSQRAFETEANFLIGLYDGLTQVEEEKPWEEFSNQVQYWNAKLTRELEARLMLGLLPDAQMFLSIMNMPENAPVKDTTKKLIEAKRKAVKQIEKQDT